MDCAQSSGGLAAQRGMEPIERTPTSRSMNSDTKRKEICPIANKQPFIKNLLYTSLGISHLPLICYSLFRRWAVTVSTRQSLNKPAPTQRKLQVWGRLMLHSVSSLYFQLWYCAQQIPKKADWISADLCTEKTKSIKRGKFIKNTASHLLWFSKFDPGTLWHRSLGPVPRGAGAVGQGSRPKTPTSNKIPFLTWRWPAGALQWVHPLLLLLHIKHQGDKRLLTKQVFSKCFTCAYFKK